MIPSQYLHLPHSQDCDCSVCFAARLEPQLFSQLQCPDCQPPGRPYRGNGRWLCRPRSFCAKHDPARRPPKYWHVIQVGEKPAPFIPMERPVQRELSYGD